MVLLQMSMPHVNEEHEIRNYKEHHISDISETFYDTRKSRTGFETF